MDDFTLSPAARQDLIDIWSYIAQDNMDAADRVTEDLFNAFQRLVQMPMIEHLRPDLTDKFVRFLGVHSYLIIYRHNTQPLQIVRILSAYRDIAFLMKE